MTKSHLNNILHNTIICKYRNEKIMDIERDRILQMDDAALSALCRISFSCGSGPGGQKRNKTSSAVKVELSQYGISASDCTERSQFRNRSNALKKLKMLLALKFRQERCVPPDNPECSMNSANYPLFAAQLLDIIHQNAFDHRRAAEICGISPTALLKKLFRDPELWQFFQNQRKILDLPVLHAPGK